MRSRGEGHIEKTDTGRWRAQISVRGRRLSSTHDTRKDAQAWLRQIASNADRGVVPTRATVGDAINEWLKRAELRVRPTSMFAYRSCAKYLNKQLGHIRLYDLRSSDIERMLSAEMEAGASACTVRHRRTILSQALREQIAAGVLAKNVAANAACPSAEHNLLPDNLLPMVQRLLDNAAGTEVEPLCRLMYAFGLRLGEALGLQWGDWDRDGYLLYVRRQLSRLGLTDLKTPASRRALTVTQEQTAYLFNLWKQAGKQNDDHRIINMTRHQAGEMFRRVADMHPDTRSMVTHNLRHAHASVLLAAGAPAHVVSRRMGHASVSITLNLYAALVPEISDQLQTALRTLDAATRKEAM